MEIIMQIIFSLVQGLTEFLPISSSGHLALLQNFLGEVDISFDIFLHFATLLAILVYFYQDIGNIIRDVLLWKTKSENFKLAIYLIIASLFLIPLAFIESTIEATFSNLFIIALGLITTGTFLFAASLTKPRGSLNLKSSLMVGLAQAIAVIPGISRSGSTTSTAMLLGVKKEKAIRFSFLLAIPAILGASVLKIDTVTFSPSLILPFILTFVAGLFSIFLFLEVIKVKNFKYFAYYCWALAILLLIWRFFS